MDAFSSQVVTMTVASDSSVDYGDSDTLTITATSGNSGDAQGTLDVTTYVRVHYGIGIEATAASASGEPGATVMFTFKVLNKWQTKKLLLTQSLCTPSPKYPWKIL